MTTDTTLLLQDIAAQLKRIAAALEAGQQEQDTQWEVVETEYHHRRYEYDSKTHKQTGEELPSMPYYQDRGFHIVAYNPGNGLHGETMVVMRRPLPAADDEPYNPDNDYCSVCGAPVCQCDEPSNDVDYLEDIPF